MSFDLAVAFGFVLVSAVLLLALLVGGRLVRMQRPGADKLSTYECGERPFGSAFFNFNNRFYVIGLVFVAFDVQVSLAVPVVVVFRRLVATHGGALVVLLFAYLGLMMLALAYVWRHGDLGWVRELMTEHEVERMPMPRAASGSTTNAAPGAPASVTRAGGI